MKQLSHEAVAYQLSIKLNSLEQPVWRRILVFPETTLGELHQIIQAVMPWEDYHLHQFVIGKKVYGDPETDEFGSETSDEFNMDLETLRQRGKRKFIYEYDFGDGWEHEIEIEKIDVEPGEGVLPRCIGGEGACPPEDSGGPHGFSEKIAILGDRSHPDHKDIKDWMGNFNPEKFSIKKTNRGLLELAVEQAISADEELLELFQSACSWCGSAMLEDQEVYCQEIQLNPDFDADLNLGRVFPLQVKSRRDPLFFLIPIKESPARKKGLTACFNCAAKNAVMSCAEPFKRNFAALTGPILEGQDLKVRLPVKQNSIADGFGRNVACIKQRFDEIRSEDRLLSVSL